MKKTISAVVIFSLASLVLPGLGFCLDGKDIVRLKEAGIDGETIQVIAREKVIETCAFTVQEILDLKKAGMGNETIRKVVESASFMKDTEPIEYGDDVKLIKFATVNDIILLKNAGISDEVIEEIISGTKSEDDENHKRAWEMLKNMGIILDKR